MRLFLSLFFLTLIQPVLTGADFYLPLENIRYGSACLTEDLDRGERTARLLIREVSTADGIKAGAFLSRSLTFPAQDNSHLNGEIITLSFIKKDESGYVLEGIRFTGTYSKPLYRVRGDFIFTIESLLFPLGESGTLLVALLLGRTERAGEIKELFRKAGVSHLLALSGLHRGIVAALVLLLLRPIVPRKYIEYFLLLFLFCYSWIIGLNFSFIRSVLMFSLFCLAGAMRIKPSPGKILPLAALIQILLWPVCIRSWSFILSYSAMGGIIYLSRRWTFWLKRVLSGPLAPVIGISLSAQAVVIPLILPGFGSFQPIGFLAGILLTPLITISIWFGIILLLLSPFFPALPGMCGPALELIYRCIQIILTSSGKIPPLQWERAGGKLLFILALSAIVMTGITVIIKDGKFVRPDTQTKLRFPLGDSGPA